MQVFQQSKILPSFTLALAATLTFAGCVPPAALSNTGKNDKADANLYHADASIALLLSKTDSQPPDVSKRAINSFRLSGKNEERAKQKAAYILARILQKGGTSAELSEAIPLYEEASGFAPLWQRCMLHISDCANTLGNESKVRTSLESIIAKATDPALKAQAHYALAQSYLRSNENENAAKEFQTVLKIGPETQFAVGARYYVGQAAMQNKDLKDGLKVWRDYLEKSPDGRFSRDIVTAILSNKEVELLPTDHKLLANFYYAHGEWAKALAEWKESGETAPWFKQATCLMRSGKSKEGKDLMMSSLSSHKSDPDVATAAKLLAHLGTREEAISIWKHVLANCPDFADMALHNLAYRAQGSDALEYYDEIVSKYPKSDFAPDASWWLVWDKIKNGQNADAIAELKNCCAKYPTSRHAPRFSYWIGKLEEKQKNTAQAKNAYENTVANYGNNYYGWRARARLNALGGKDDPGWTCDFSKHFSTYSQIQSGGGWTWPVPPHLISFRDITTSTNQTMASLAELHQWDECLELLPKDTLPELRSICLAKLNMVLDAINAMSHDLKGSPDTGPKWQIAYPLLHNNIIKTESSTKQVDPLLAHALIREESRYNIHALSSSNAIGLMQLLPATAMGVAKRLGVSIKSHEDIHKPENNLKLGIDYLSYTLGRFNGNAMLAVASYNGGPNAVASWTHKLSMDDPDTFVENIPYTETRDYVRKVFGSYWNYAAIYKPKPQTGSAGAPPASRDTNVATTK